MILEVLHHSERANALPACNTSDAASRTEGHAATEERGTRNEEQGTGNEEREIGRSGHAATEKRETRNEKWHRSVVRSPLTPIKYHPLYPAADLLYSTGLARTSSISFSVLLASMTACRRQSTLLNSTPIG